jgi:hypothetical protein
VVKTVEPVVRPKGLGLGASRPKPAEGSAAATEGKEGDEKLVLKRGAFIRVESGRKAGLYGEVEGFDEENARSALCLFPFTTRCQGLGYRYLTKKKLNFFTPVKTCKHICTMELDLQTYLYLDLQTYLYLDLQFYLDL